MFEPVFLRNQSKPLKVDLFRFRIGGGLDFLVFFLKQIVGVVREVVCGEGM